MSNTRVATSVHSRMPLEIDVNEDNAFSLAAFKKQNVKLRLKACSVKNVKDTNSHLTLTIQFY